MVVKLSKGRVELAAALRIIRLNSTLLRRRGDFKLQIMRKKFVQTLAAQQLEMSTHIRAPGDMEPGKEHRQQQATRTSRDSPQSSEHSRSDPQVIEILDDDNDVELMMERHRKYHPRKYVNLQQPPSKIYYDPVDRPSSPAPDRADQHKQVNGAGEQEEEEGDEERQLVIDCVRDAVSASSSSSKEPNNNSADMANGNHAEERDSNGEPAGPTSLQAPPPTTPAAVPDLTNAADNSEQLQQHQQKSPKKDAAPSSGFNWHVPQNQNLTPVGPPPQLRPLLQCPPNVPRPRPDTPAPRMMMMQQQQQQQHDRLPPHLRGHRSNPYERPPAGNDHSAALEARRRAATPHPGAMAGHRTPSAPQPTAESARKSAFCAPRESRQPYRSAIMPPPPPLMPSLPGTVASSVAAAPRTPFYHNPFLQPFLHYQPHGGGAPDPQTYHTLEEWYRAGYPAPHLLTPADLDFYYNCFLSKMLFGAAIGYHRQQQQQQHHEQLYRNYPALAMTPGNAFYPPPQYGFVKPITATAPGPVASTTAAPTAATPVPAAANAPSQAINFTQLYNGGAPSSAAAGYHSTSLPSTTTAQTHQSPQRVPHTPYFMNHSIPPRPGVMERAGTPAPGHPSAPRPSSAALMPPPPGAASGSRKRSAPSASSAKRPPSGRADPPAYLAPPSQSISMPPSAYSIALPPPSNHPLAGNVAAQHTTNSMPPPSNHAPFDYTHSTAAAAATVTTYATPTILSTMLSSPDRMPPPSNHPPYSTVSDRSPPARSATPAPGRGMPSPTNHHRSPTLGSPSTNMSPESMARPSHPATSNHLISNGNPFPNIMTSGSMPPPSNHPPSNMGSPTATDTSTAGTLLSAGSMPPPSNHPPYHTTTSTSSMSSPGSMPPPSSYPSAGSSNAPTTSSSSMPTPPTVNPNYSSSSFPMMPPIISYLLPPMPPTTSTPSTMSSPSAIPTTSTSSAAAAAHNAPASMPSLDTVYASSSMMPPPSTPSTSNRAAASGQPTSPPTTAANANGSKRGSRAAPKSSPSTSRTPEPPTPPAPKRRNRRASVAASQSPYLTAPPSQSPIPPLPPTPRPPPIATPTDTTLDTTNLGSILTSVRQEMASFLQLRRTDILTTMRIYTGGRTDFALFLAEMKRHNVTYRDFMHVAFALMRRYGQDRFAKEPPSELDYQWANPPQEFATYFSNIHPCTHQFVGENFEFLLLVVDNLLHQYFEPMEYFLLTYVFGVGPRTSGAGWSGSDRALRER